MHICPTYNLGLADTLTAAGVNDGARVAELCLQEECSSLAALAELTPALLDRLVSRAGLKSLSEARFRRLVEDAQGVDRALPVSIGVIIAADAVPPPAAAVPADQRANNASTPEFSGWGLLSRLGVVFDTEIVQRNGIDRASLLVVRLVVLSLFSLWLYVLTVPPVLPVG